MKLSTSYGRSLIYLHITLIFVCCGSILLVIWSNIEFYSKADNSSQIPLVINTWPFTHATAKAWDSIYNKNLSAIDAVEIGCSVCEDEQCDFTVGFGGSPDENGETTLDAFIMDGTTMNVGAVGALRNVKSAISVARHVLEHTSHSILVGELATQFALELGFRQESLATNKSKEMWQEWRSNSCQPNYWIGVSPDPKHNCGPYSSLPSGQIPRLAQGHQQQQGHDTISMLALDREVQFAVGTSSNGANHKIPGRVGDAPLVGAGGYADSTVGAAACTGDGDVMMRFLPSFLAVEELRRGACPQDAANTAISRIKKYYPSFSGAIIVANIKGEYAASCHGMAVFPYSVHSPTHPSGVVEDVPCI